MRLDLVLGFGLLYLVLLCLFCVVLLWVVHLSGVLVSFVLPC